MSREEELNQIEFLNSQPEKKYRSIYCWYLASYVDDKSSYYFTYDDLQSLGKIPIDDRYFYMKHILDVREVGWTWFNNSCYVGSYERFTDICKKYELDDGVRDQWRDSALTD